MPIPLSCTLKNTPSGFFPVRMVMASPFCVYLAALSISILAHCFIIDTSPLICACSPMNSYSCSVSIIFDSSKTSPMSSSSCIFSICRLFLPLSPLARKRSCSTSFCMCSDSFLIASIDSSRMLSSSLPQRSSISA